MKLKLFAIRDAKTASFGNPIVFQARGQAIRSVSDEVNRRNSGEQSTTLQQHPEDFELFEIGEFDTDTGLITQNFESVCSCSDLKLASN